MSIPRLSDQINNPQSLIKRMNEHNWSSLGQKDKSFQFQTMVMGETMTCEVEIQPGQGVNLRAFS